MYAVIFEVQPKPEHFDGYLTIAAELKPLYQAFGRTPPPASARILHATAQSAIRLGLVELLISPSA